MKYYIFLILCFIFFGCQHEDFSPVRNFEEKLAVFSVLDSRNDLTFLYLQKNSDSWDISERLSLPENITVKVIKNNNKEYIFKDTVIIVLM